MAHKHQYDFYVPTINNLGEPFCEVTMRDLRHQLIELGGGLTVLPYADGYWKDNGDVMVDEIAIHRVLVDCRAQVHVEVARIHKWMLTVLEQKEVLIVRTEVNVVDAPIVDAVEHYNRNN
jgi:hypothetical protein